MGTEYVLYADFIVEGRWPDAESEKALFEYNKLIAEIENEDMTVQLFRENVELIAERPRVTRDIK